MMNVSMHMDKIGGLASLSQGILYALVFVSVIFGALCLRVGEAALIAYLALLHRVQPLRQGARRSAHEPGFAVRLGRAVSELFRFVHGRRSTVGGKPCRN